MGERDLVSSSALFPLPALVTASVRRALYELMRFASDAQSGVVSAAQPNCRQSFHAEDSIERKASPGALDTATGCWP